MLACEWLGRSMTCPACHSSPSALITAILKAGGNPNTSAVDGEKCYPSLTKLPERPDAVIFITPPEVTAAVIREALGLGIGTFWMQPGADGPEAVRLAKEAGAEPIYGRCVLVTDPEKYL